MTSRQNFIGQTTPSIVDTEYEECNFAQPQPVDSGGGVYVGVRLFPGDDTPRTFRRCNLCNCEPPPGSTLEQCNTTIKRNRVVTSSEDVTVDGVVTSLDHHSHFVEGRWTPGGYEYHPSPVEIEVD